MNRILINCGFVIATILVIAAFMTATTYAQLTVAVCLYPLLIVFLFKAFPRKTQINATPKPLANLVASSAPPVQPIETVEPTPEPNRAIGIADIDKRVFLKLIGGVGLSLFLFSIFNKKAEGLFFKNAPAAAGKVGLEDISGKKIDPAQLQPTDGYRISEIDDNVITFYGFTNKDGGWFVMKEDSDSGSFRYCKGDGNFPESWINRENLKYGYFSDVF